MNPETFRAAPSPFRLPRWANIGVSIVAVLLIGALATAIAIPMHRKHQLDAEYQRTRIAIPKNFNGAAGASTGETEAALKKVATGFTSITARIYAKNTLSLVLVAAFRPPRAMDDADQANERAQLIKQVFTSTSISTSTSAAAAAALNLVAVTDPGPLGGYMGCGKSVESSTVCIATDAGSMVAVVMGPAVSSPESVALKAREATVTRTA